MKSLNDCKEVYDSTKDTIKHKTNVMNVFDYIIIPELINRAIHHDASKLESPEKDMYDKYIPLLRTAKYGTKEYLQIRSDMANDGLNHHFESNRHHPEHFKNGISGMDLIDFVEMICDWFAASLVSDTSFIDGLDGNVKRFNLPDEITCIIKNTYKNYFKDMETYVKSGSEDFVKDVKIRVISEFIHNRLTKDELDKLFVKLDGGNK